MIPTVLGKRMLDPWKKRYDKLRQHIKMQRHHFANKSPYGPYGFSSNHVWIWELDHKEGWALKNWCFLTVMLEKTLDSSLNCKIKPVHLKGNQSWILIGRTDAEAETPILWPPAAKTDSLEKTVMLERFKSGGEWDDRGWDDLMVSPTQWTWVWAI